MLIPFDDIILEPEQQDLLCLLVETSRSLPRNKREKFLLQYGMDGYYLGHPRLPHFQAKIYKGDVEHLNRVGLVFASYGDRYLVFDVTPEGFRYYEYLKSKNSQPLRRTESHSRAHLFSDQFQTHYPKTFNKWSEAEKLLWEPESATQLTTIGHLCREAMQEFATELVDKHKPANVDTNKAHDVSRIKSVISANATQIGDTTHHFLDVLLSYWGDC
jgi:hypothetical protein